MPWKKRGGQRITKLESGFTGREQKENNLIELALEITPI